MYAFMEIISLALIPTFLLLDFILQARRYSKPRFWRVRSLLVTIGIFLLSGEIALLWATVLGDFHLFDGDGLGIWGGAVVGIVVYEFFHYWYHRLAHSWNWLWYAGHQLHHSAESLDAFGAYYMHPFDAFMFATIASLVFYPLLGLAAEAGIVAVLFLTFNAMFQHANIRTPRWLGYLIQRPESHAVHHGRSIHRHNYSDLPLWDMLFGSFFNPHAKQVPAECGFYKGASSRLFAMLIGRDVSEPAAANNQPVVIQNREAA
ncbi:MAG: sterol desaturase family protein [Thioalkalispiraceae bacterium]|jgi:sterol desaturase/sphingolipid hydroxylase (fatty acid hydroxylase superfamily)